MNVKAQEGASGLREGTLGGGAGMSPDIATIMSVARSVSRSRYGRLRGPIGREDIEQEIALALWSQRDTLDAAKPRLMRCIAKRRAADAWRRIFGREGTGRRDCTQATVSLSDPGVPYADMLTAPDSREDPWAGEPYSPLVRAALDRLTPRQRETLLAYAEARSIRTVAEQECVTRQAVAITLRRARARMRRALGRAA